MHAQGDGEQVYVNKHLCFTTVLSPDTLKLTRIKFLQR